MPWRKFCTGDRIDAGALSESRRLGRCAGDSDRTVVPFVSEPEAQKLSFPGRGALRLRSVVLHAWGPKSRLGLSSTAAPVALNSGTVPGLLASASAIAGRAARNRRRRLRPLVSRKRRPSTPALVIKATNRFVRPETPACVYNHSVNSRTACSRLALQTRD